MDAEKAKEVLEKRYKRQNAYIKSTYDRISVTLPKGTKEKILASGETVNGLINRLIVEYLEQVAVSQGQPSETEKPQDLQAPQVLETEQRDETERLEQPTVQERETERQQGTPETEQPGEPPQMYKTRLQELQDKITAKLRENDNNI